MNAVLTVRASQANSHKDKGWEKFTDWVISWVAKNLDGVVFMLWGAYAQKKCSKIDTVRIFKRKRVSFIQLFLELLILTVLAVECVILAVQNNAT